MFVKYYFTGVTSYESYIYCIRAHVYKNGKVRVVHDDDSNKLLSEFVYDATEHFLITVLKKGMVLYDVRIPEEVK